MPSTRPLGLHSINQKEFAELDYRVMRVAFECQNELGRLCEETIYQNDLVARLKAVGLPGNGLSGHRIDGRDLEL
jgi:hypothetical protein